MTEPAPEAPAAPPSHGGGGSGFIIPVLSIGLGGYLAWFAIHYWRSQSVAWPSDPIKAVLQGKPVPSSTPAAGTAVQLAAYETSLSASPAAAATGTGGTGGGSAPTGPLSGSAQNMARLLLSKFGWAASQMAPLVSLWNRESGWSASARNSSSGAFGIAQALGHGTSCSAAPNGTNEYGPEYGLSCSEAQQANAGSARWQIEWGLGYIKSAYGDPAGAWSHEQSAGWY